MRVIDFHTHAFPDALAARAVKFLEGQAHVKGKLDGTVAGFLKSMEVSGVEKSVVASIATKPDHFDPIFNWSKEIASEKLVPFPSVHPADPRAAERVAEIADAGFMGVKLHPYYQEFDLDEKRMFPLYEVMQERGLILLCHTGYDIAYPRDRKGDPARIAKVLQEFPRLILITTHMGAWEDWKDTEHYLLGKPIYMETSFSIDYMGKDAARDFLLRHPADFLLFGTDSPWADQKEAINELRSLNLGDALERKILFENAARLLNNRGQ